MEQIDYQKSLESIIKKAINKYIELLDIKGDFHYKMEYQHSDSNAQFSSSLLIGVRTANIVEVHYEKYYTSYISKEDMLVDALINMVLGYVKRVDYSVINN